MEDPRWQAHAGCQSKPSVPGSDRSQLSKIAMSITWILIALPHMTDGRLTVVLAQVARQMSSVEHVLRE
jgi:hypothetical protein